MNGGDCGGSCACVGTAAPSMQVSVPPILHLLCNTDLKQLVWNLHQGEVLVSSFFTLRSASSCFSLALSCISKFKYNWFVSCFFGFSVTTTRATYSCAWIRSYPSPMYCMDHWGMHVCVRLGAGQFHAVHGHPQACPSHHNQALEWHRSGLWTWGSGSQQRRERNRNQLWRPKRSTMADYTSLRIW